MKFSVMEWSSRPKKDAPADYYRRMRAIGYEAIELPSLDAAAAVQAAGLAALSIAAPWILRGLYLQRNSSARVTAVFLILNNDVCILVTAPISNPTRHAFLASPAS